MPSRSESLAKLLEDSGYRIDYNTDSQFSTRWGVDIAKRSGEITNGKRNKGLLLVRRHHVFRAP